MVELENQSDRIEDQIETNKELTEKIQDLQREVNTHKYVEVNFSS